MNGTGTVSLVYPGDLPAAAASWQRGLAATVSARILEVNERASALGRGAIINEEVGP